MAKVLVVAAHPDDETLGVGGTIFKHNANGDQVYWLIVTNIFEQQGYSAEKVKQRQDEIDSVGLQFGFVDIFKLDYPTMGLSGGSLLSLIPLISGIFGKIEPEIIYVMNRSDAHSDHRVIFDAVSACTKAFRYPYIKKVLMYECISETEFAPQLPEKVFIPNYFVDISEFLGKKLEIMQVYQSELGEHPFPRSNRNIEALATFRGATVGVNYAEAFQLIKFIDK
jgi:LmbE family N-acetylglucosaminyl deacetylase